MVVSLKIVIKELLSQINLSKAYTFYIYKLIDSIVINKNKNFVFTIFQIVAPSFKYLNNG